MQPAHDKTKIAEIQEELKQVQKKMVALKEAFPIHQLTDQDPEDLAYLPSVPDYDVEFLRFKQRENELKLELIKLGESAPSPRRKEKERAMSVKSSGDDLSHSGDYRSVTLRGENYSLTGTQAAVIKILHEAYENGTAELSGHYILEQLGTPNSRLRDTFKTNPKALKGLIMSGKTKGTYRLNQ
jgi:hypothetical protein